jgi:hypothetical protein
MVHLKITKLQIKVYQELVTVFTMDQVIPEIIVVVSVVNKQIKEVS